MQGIGRRCCSFPPAKLLEEYQEEEVVTEEEPEALSTLALLLLIISILRWRLRFCLEARSSSCCSISPSRVVPLKTHVVAESPQESA